MAQTLPISCLEYCRDESFGCDGEITEPNERYTNHNTGEKVKGGDKFHEASILDTEKGIVGFSEFGNSFGQTSDC